MDVSNVYLYIGDAVRDDALPAQLNNKGMTIKTVAASIHTPPSFSSIVTGLCPPQHGVWNFDTSIEGHKPTLLDISGYSTRFANTINEKFNDNPESESLLNQILGTEAVSYKTLETIEQPFVFIERGRGGHAPYGNFSGNAWEYFRDRKATDKAVYREEYQEGINADINHFEDQLARLEERGILEETLVIYTSDHGELLGEQGCLGHNGPIHPKLSYVPSVFIHPDLDSTTIEDGLLRHIDLLPTIFGFIDESVTVQLPGRNVASRGFASRGACFYNKSLISGFSPLVSGDLRYESVWDTNGGYVFPQTNLINRLIILLGKLGKSAKREYMRHHLWDVFRFYGTGVTTYGHPTITSKEARGYLQDIYDSDIQLDYASELEVDRDRLRELGYLS